MNTLTYGMKVPEPGDVGSTWFQGLEDNFTQLDAHSHNGTNSPLLDASYIADKIASISSAGWVLVANGIYRQIITVPTNMDVDTTFPQFRFSGGSFANQSVDLKTEKINDTTFYVYINDNSQNLTVIYT